jgi:CTD nuclear envelope phosphatase 1
MNSLTYLSRQFDVLASPRTPPSTPSEERNSFLNDGGVRALQQDGTSDTSLKRIKTWSTKSFLFPPALRTTRPSTPKRSHSSPADIITMAALATRSTTTNSSEVTVRSKAGAYSLLRRVFFVRVFVALWNALRSGWASLARRDAARTADTTVEEGTDTDEKETEDESQGEKFVSLVSSTPPHQPPISPFPSPPSANVPSIIYSLHRSDTDPAFSSESQLGIGSSQSQQLLSLSSSQSTVLSGSTSRCETPPFPTRKTPFHLPKTLVLDLDETLIHSTSRPLFASGSGGSGLLGLGGFGKRNKGAGHVVEVVLGGRSTLYHVYKRPFVDYFLRKVCWFATAQVISLINDALGLGMVHTGHIYCIYARVRGPCNRLARCWSRNP